MWLPASGRILHRVGVIGDIHCEHEMLDRALRHFRSIDVDTILSVVAVHGPKISRVPRPSFAWAGFSQTSFTSASAPQVHPMSAASLILEASTGSGPLKPFHRSGSGHSS